MKYLFSLAFILLSLSSVYGQECDCEKYKTGKFIIYDKEIGISRIKRTKKVQIERAEGVVAKSYVVWLDECSYKLVEKSTRDKTGIMGDDDIYCKIVETGEDYYIVLVSMGQSKDGLRVRMEVDK